MNRPRGNRPRGNRKNVVARSGAGATKAPGPSPQSAAARRKDRQRKVIFAGIGLVFVGGVAAPFALSVDPEPAVDTEAAPREFSQAIESEPAPTPPESAEPAANRSETTEAGTAEAETTEPETTEPEVFDPLSFGASGEQVEALQARLVELGFALGPVDGEFDVPTRAAVWAFENLVMDVAPPDVTGVVTGELWESMRSAGEIEPRRRFSDGEATENHTEVYLPQQVVVFFEDDVAVLITHMSSGTSQEWRADVTIDPGEFGNNGTEPIVRGEIGIAVTPGGVFTYDRLVEGVRDTSLGGMWEPAFFNFGIAIHGALDVPSAPATRGSIRVPMHVAEVFHDHIAVGDQVFVWDGFREPEDYGEQAPIPSRIDPDGQPAAPGTTAPTTVVAPTTVPAPTTVAAPTTAAGG